METPFPRLFHLELPLSHFRDESTSPRMSLVALPQWYEDSYLRLLNGIQKYHLP